MRRASRSYDQTMELCFHGAAGEVTGSCHLLEVAGRRVLLDCGLIQGSYESEQRNRDPFPFDPAAIDAVVLSHAHIDHSGRIPLLVKAGYEGPIYAQTATRELCHIMLWDAAYLNEKETLWDNRKRERRGQPLLKPLYMREDVQAAMAQYKSVPYGRVREILPGLKIRFRDAGHILGSAIVEVWGSEQGQTRKLVFSGDLGPDGAPILRDPAIIADADLVVMESTYGDRRHRSTEDTLQELSEIFREASRSHGNILIPAFAVGRSQNLIYYMGKHYQDWGLEGWHIFLDSPMAIRATGVYARHSSEYDREARELWAQRPLGEILPNLRFTRTSQQSMGINKVHSGAIIMAGSGMCEGGRIKHHLKNNLWRKGCHVIMVGFQARGTTGRALVDGAESIRLWGEEIRVQAKIHTVGGLSAHADQEDLVNWYGHFDTAPPLWLVHGEPEAQQALQNAVAKRFPGRNVQIAGRGQKISL